MRPPVSLPLTPRDYWDLAVRRKSLITGVLLATLAVAGLLILVLPKSYRSSTLILVEDQKIPEDYVKGVVVGTIESRLMLIQQQVMSRTLLSRLIEEFNLYQGKIFEDVIKDMRKNITVETVGTVGISGQKTVEAFSISFAHGNPMMAMKVTARLASLFIEENLRAREQLVEGASEFLDHELARTKVKLEEQEQAISNFKKMHIGELPEHADANLRELEHLRADMNATAEAIQSLGEREKTVAKALHDYEQTGVAKTGITEVRGRPDTLVARLRELHQELARLRAEYKETYPDIPRVKKEIAQIKAELEAKRRTGEAEEQSDVMLTTTTGADTYRLDLRQKRDETKIGLSAAQERQRRLTQQIAELEGRLRRAPMREQELMVLVRDYQNMKGNYQALFDKKLRAQIAENLEKRQKGEQFRIIDPANLPEKPEKPNRLRILAIGLILGCGLGVGAAMMVEQMNPVFRRPEEVDALLGLPVLAAIPSFTLLFRGAGTTAPRALPPPRLRARAGPAGDGKRNGNGRRDGRRVWKGGWVARRAVVEQVTGELNLVAKWSPLSIVAEQFRVAATRLALMAAERRHTVLVVTSAVKGEGKTAVAANLAYTLARDLGKDTLLIDGDTKSPTLHSYVGVRPEPGLSDVLRGTCAVEPCLARVGEWSLWVLPAGNQDERGLELSKIRRLGSFLAELRERFEYIVLDAPPILPLADMNVLVGMADLLALVIRAETTSRDVLVAALNGLKPTVQTAVVLTDLHVKDASPYYYTPRPARPGGVETVSRLS